MRAVACLTVLSSPDSAARGSVHLLGVATCVGREPAERELVWIADPRLGLRHCRILRSPQGYTLEDLASGSGSYVNGVRASLTRLHLGDLVRCGDTLMLFGGLDLAAVRWVHPRLSGLVGHSSSLVRALIQVASLAASDQPLLIRGEPGSGRARLAWELHRQSGRGGPLISYDCRRSEAAQHLGDISGREGRGDHVEAGLLHAACGGTLYLSELDALDPDAAARLRAYFASPWPPPGSASRLLKVRPRPRLVAAECLPTDAATAIDPLGPARITLLPLRERRKDILPLTEHFLRLLAPRRSPLHEKAPRLHPDLQEALMLQQWPDNADGIRELARRMLIINAGSERLGPELAEQLGLTMPAQAAGTSAPCCERPAASMRLPTAPPRGEAPKAEELELLYEALGRSVRCLSLYLGRDRSLVYRWLHGAGLA